MAATQVTKVSGMRTILRQYCPAISLGTFGYYLCELKYRRLVRVSEEFGDGDDLRGTNMLALVNDEGARPSSSLRSRTTSCG